VNNDEDVRVRGYGWLSSVCVGCKSVSTGVGAAF